MKKLIILLLFYSTISVAQEIPEPVNGLTAQNVEILRHVWKASWISHPTASPQDYGVFLFRNKFILQTVPQKLLIYVSGDNRYKLYVNGKYISNGPARGDQLNWNYETVDIAPVLHAGENIIAAEIINYGNQRPVAQHSFQTAFLLQSADSNYAALNTGGTNWKVTQSMAYKPIAISFAMVNGYYASGPCDSVNAKLFEWGWTGKDYDDSRWVNPIVTNLAVGRGFIYGNSLYLVPRQIPVLERKQERFFAVVRSDVNAYQNAGFISGTPTVIKKHSKLSILLDQSYLTTGYPQLSISKGTGSSIKITYAEALIDDNGIKGNRNQIKGKHILGYHDNYFPDGGNDRLFETLWQRTFRYVQMDIVTGNEDLVINDFHNIFTAFAFVQQASFSSDQPALKQIWDVAWRTARLCAGETYFDCPYYEQLQYVGDTRIQALISLNVAGDDRLMRSALQLFDQSRIPDGLTLSRYPSNIPQIIPTYSLMWINMIHDYHLYRDDSLFIKQFDKGIVTILEWFASRVDKTGLLGNLEWWNFSDYTDPFALGIPPGADGGHSALTTLQFVYALQNASRLFTYFKEDDYAAKYLALAEKLQKAVMLTCYDEKRGLIAETPEKKVFSEHTTLFGILTNTIDKNSQREVLLKAISDTSLIIPSFYFQFYLSRGLQQTGLGDRYLSTLGTFKQMLNEGLTTFAEMAGNPRSDCHAWSASPLFDFMNVVAGIQPASPGFKTVLIAPNFRSLTKIDVRYPHPMGAINVHLVKTGLKKVTGTIQLPEKITGTFVYKNKTIPLNGGNLQTINIDL